MAGEMGGCVHSPGGLKRQKDGGHLPAGGQPSHVDWGLDEGEQLLEQ